MLVLFLCSLSLFQENYFRDVALYRPEKQQIEQGFHVKLDHRGVVRVLGKEPLEVGTSVVFENVLILPHLSDFYSLVQERGLGLDEDVDGETQKRLSTYLRTIGLHVVRDPVFPQHAIVGMGEEPQVYAQGGYVALKGGPGEGFNLVLDPNKSLEGQMSRLPLLGPVTLWWTALGDDDALTWSDHPGFVLELHARLKQRGQTLGCFIQGAKLSSLEALAPFDFDFFEGIPAINDPKHLTMMKDAVWIPLLGLNDRRYCGDGLKVGLDRAGGLGLYALDRVLALRDQVDTTVARMEPRCRIWKERRQDVYDLVRAWHAGGGAVGIGSAGGNQFCFSGDIRFELERLHEAGLTEQALLAGLFQHNPDLFGISTPFLMLDKPANFVVLRLGPDDDWLQVVGHSVLLSFVHGVVVKDSRL